LRRDFLVRVTHDDKPLAGVAVEVTTNSGESIQQFFGISGADGTVRVSGLPPGEYWLKAEMLGVTAGVECFHVGQHATRKAKRTVTYAWGELASAVHSISGRVFESRPGQGDNPFWNAFHRINVAINGVKLRLQQPLTPTVYSTTSDQEGDFAFDQRIPEGIYVLHIEGRTSTK
jgi:Carboxypeptidase regulatory-like domain